MSNLQDNQTINLIQSRRSIRKFTTEQITNEQLDTLLHCAFAAPSGCNKQPWHISVVQDQKLLKEISDDTLSRIHEVSNVEINKNFKLFYGAPTVLFISYDEENSWAPYDVGILTGNVTTAAQALGLGSCIIGMVRGLFTPVEQGDIAGLVSVLDENDVKESDSIKMMFDTNKKYRELLNIPKGYSVPFGIAIGVPDGNLPKARDVVYKVSRA
ncbi:reductase [Clostridioides difficile]|nr:reductase [Clostridioides difficile]MDB3083885.1 reductase [Clostridioides difficile]MDI0267342.1 nitroreductase [Clostridioides difficile]